ncbi:hypothetical protein FBU59_000340, partial [Linderina macrospora]
MVNHQPVTAVLDVGSEATLITQKAAKQLQLQMSTRSRPVLKPLWGGKGHVSAGRAKLRVAMMGIKPRWVNAVVVNWDVEWDLLIGEPLWQGFNIITASPAVVKSLKRRAKKEEHEVTADNTVQRVASDEVYAKVGEVNISRTIDINFGQPEGQEGALMARKFESHEALPTNFFHKQRDADLEHWDAKYPDVSQEE